MLLLLLWSVGMFLLLLLLPLIVLHAVGSIVTLPLPVLLLLRRWCAAVDMLIGQLLCQGWRLQRIRLPVAGGGHCLRGRSTGSGQILMRGSIVAIASVAAAAGGEAVGAQRRRWHDAMHYSQTGCSGAKCQQSADKCPELPGGERERAIERQSESETEAELYTLTVESCIISWAACVRVCVCVYVRLLSVCVCVRTRRMKGEQ